MPVIVVLTDGVIFTVSGGFTLEVRRESAFIIYLLVNILNTFLPSINP